MLSDGRLLTKSSEFQRSSSFEITFKAREVNWSWSTAIMFKGLPTTIKPSALLAQQTERHMCWSEKIMDHVSG